MHRKGQPRLRLAFLTDAYLLAEQRFDIQPLRLQDFAQTAQAFNLNLANTFTGGANFTTYIFQCCRFVPSKPDRRASTSRCLAFSSNSHLTMLCFISSSCVVSSGPFSFSSARDLQQRFFGITTQRGVYRGNALVKTKHTADVINWLIQLLCDLFRTWFMVQLMGRTARAVRR